MLNTLQVLWKSSLAIFVYPPTPRFHDWAPVFSRVSAICEYGVCDVYVFTLRGKMAGLKFFTCHTFSNITIVNIWYIPDCIISLASFCCSFFLMYSWLDLLLGSGHSVLHCWSFLLELKYMVKNVDTEGNKFELRETTWIHSGYSKEGYST